MDPARRIASGISVWLLLAAFHAPSLLAGPDPLARLPSSEYAARRARVLDRLRSSPGGKAAALLRSPAAARFSGDVDYPYRPDNDLIYLTGIADEGAALLLSATEVEGLGQEVLFLPPRGPSQGVWVSPGLTPAQASAESGIPEKSVLALGDLAATLRKALPPARGGHGAPEPPPPPRLYFDAGGRARPGDPLPPGYQLLLGHLGTDAFHLDLVEPWRLTAPLREVKSPAELAILGRAIGITCEAHKEAMRLLRPGLFEYEVAARIEYEFRARGASGWAFPSIVGSGPNSCILHYERYDRQLAEGDLVVIDIGSEYGHYAADVTRTLPVSGRFSERQRRVYQIVFEAQEAAMRAIRPGLPYAEVHRTASDVVTAGLIGLGLIKEKAEARKYFPHGTSHGLGLDVHDPMPSPTLRPGMVVTVEPGIYIPEESLGVRIEDDVLVTEDGFKLLSDGAPRTAEEVERWMRSESL